jgi:uncharacterized protein
MSQELADTVRGIYEAFGAGDVPTIIAAFDPQVEWWEAEHHPYADRNPYVGPTAILEGVFMRIGTEWDGFTVAPDGILDAGETIVSHGHYSGTYKNTGKDVRAQFAHFFSFRDGKIVKFQQYTDTAQFAEAVTK